MTESQVTWAQEIANARHGPDGCRERWDPPARDHDHLADPGLALAYLGRRGEGSPGVAPPGIPPSDAELEALRAVAGSLAALTDVPEGPGAPDLGRLLTMFRYRLRPDGSVVTDGQGWHAIAGEGAAGVVALGSESGRLRRCSNPDCRWIFVDESRNHSRVWCDIGCSSRAKMARYRQRRRAGALGEATTDEEARATDAGRS